MRLIGVLVLLVSIASAQVARPGRRGPARDNAAPDGPSADSLLRIVHDEAQQLAPTDRAAVLSHAIQSAARVQPDLVLPWTEELFNLAPQVAEDRRATLELTPVVTLASRDVDAALRLLERMDPPSKTMLDAGNDPRAAAAGSVFGQYWGRRGRRFRSVEVAGEDEEATPSTREKTEQTKKLNRMREIAARLGAGGGVFPYSAFAAPLAELKVQDAAAQEALFAELLNAFRSSPGRYADIAEFVRMLMNARGEAPSVFYREALTMAVAAIDRIPADGLPAMNYSYRGQTATGQLSGQLNNAASLQLMRIIPLIREVDPEWAKQVLEQHQDVAQFEQSRSAPGTIVSLGGGNVMMGPSPSPNRSPQRQLAPVRAAAQNSGEAAKLFAGQISDPAARAAASAEIAAGLAAQNPQEAATYMTQASEGLATIDDPASQLMVVTSLARAAFETGDRASAAAYSERGFRLGEDVVRADYDANPDKPVMSLKGASDLASLVVTGMRLDPASTVTRVQGIRYPLLRANLLLSAVDAVSSRRGLRSSIAARVVESVQSVNIESRGAPGASVKSTKPPE